MLRTRLGLLTVCVALAAPACATLHDQPPPEYAFHQPLFNEPWATSAAVAREVGPTRTRAPRARASRDPAARSRGAAPERSALATVAAARRADAAGPGDEPTGLVPTALRAADPSATTGVAPAPIAAPAGRGHGDRRAETLEAARRLIGMRDAFDARGFLHHLLSVGEVRLAGIGGEPELRDVYRALRSQALTYDRSAPQPGDLVFFHNTADDNGDGRQNDWYSLAGVVESVDGEGTITVILPVEGEVGRRSLNLDRPEVRRLESTGAVLNDVLRTKRLDDPPYTQYLAGELYAGFAALPD